MTARVARGVCRSQKTRYRNKNAVMAGIDHTRQCFRKMFDRVAPLLYPYRCPLCSGWHMTHLAPIPIEGDKAA